ncbi:unnamed protein product [Sphacelaria rigidula]
MHAAGGRTCQSLLSAVSSRDEKKVERKKRPKAACCSVATAIDPPSDQSACCYWTLVSFLASDCLDRTAVSFSIRNMRRIGTYASLLPILPTTAPHTTRSQNNANEIRFIFRYPRNHAA